MKLHPYSSKVARPSRLPEWQAGARQGRKQRQGALEERQLGSRRSTVDPGGGG